MAAQLCFARIHANQFAYSYIAKCVIVVAALPRFVTFATRYVLPSVPGILTVCASGMTLMLKRGPDSNQRRISNANAPVATKAAYAAMRVVSPPVMQP
jgi:hypothetical protein